MSNTAKTVLITLAICIAFGAAVTGIALTVININSMLADTDSQVITTHDITESFDSINVNELECDVIIRPSTDGKTRIKTTETPKMYCEVGVDNGTLNILRIDERIWYENFSYSLFKEASVEIYLPKGDYDMIDIYTVSGDISLFDDYSFKEAGLFTVSGDIHFRGDIKGNLSAETTSGDIELANMKAQNAQILTVSGDTELTAFECSNCITIDSVSGDIELTRSDAKSLNLNAVSGDIEALLNSAKSFETETTSGDIKVPDSDSSKGLCYASTVSGDIHIKIS